MSELDLVIPVYKSKNTIPQLVADLESWVAAQSFSVRVIFVEDGGNDGTLEILKSRLEDSNLKHNVYQLIKNYGQYTATSVGFYYSTADWVATIDDDLQHPVAELTKLLDARSDQQLIYGTFEVKKHALWRNLGSTILKRIFVSQGANYEHVTSFRLFRKEVIAPFKQRIAPVLFLDEQLHRHALKVGFVSVNHAPRDGKSSYSNFKLMKLALTLLLFHTALPLKFITRFGILMSFVFMLFGFYFIYNKMVNDVPLGFTSMIVALFFSTGLILVSLGIIGEYIRKIWISQNHLDQVIVLEK